MKKAFTAGTRVQWTYKGQIYQDEIVYISKSVTNGRLYDLTYLMKKNLLKAIK